MRGWGHEEGSPSKNWQILALDMLPDIDVKVIPWLEKRNITFRHVTWTPVT